jgi:hypothetical protein
MAPMKVAETPEALLLGGVTLPSGRTASVQEAVALASPQRLVVHQGQVVARTTLTCEVPGRAEATAVPSHRGAPA